MKKFLVVYRGAVQPKDGQKHMASWMSWVHGMGDAMVDPGIPVGASVTVSATEIISTKTENPICGTSVIQAADIDDALELVKPCPHLNIGGTIEISEAMNLPMS